jgi:uncharacterized GH25 family protein
MTSLTKFFGAALLASTSAFAHEFWLQPASAIPSAAGNVDITLHVGEYYVGELVGVTTQHAASVRLFSASGTQDLMSRVPTGNAVGALRVPVQQPGTHVLAYDSHPSEVVLSGDKFHAYLHEEGLDQIIRQREATGSASQPGRERFRRHAKALLKVGQSDRTSLAPTGQRLELVPQSDPFARAEQRKLGLEVRYEGKPLAGVLVKAWHKRNGQTIVVRARSDDKGTVNFELPYSGPWMMNAVHMVPAKGVPNIDWESLWSSLTFEAP